MQAETVSFHTEKKPDGIYVVYINGNIVCNLSGTQVRGEVERILALPPPQRLILNIHDVRYLDSFCFGWLVKMYKEAKKREALLRFPTRTRILSA